MNRFFDKLTAPNRRVRGGIFVVAIFRDIAVFSGRFVGDAYMHPGADYPVYCIARMAATGGI